MTQNSNGDHSLPARLWRRFKRRVERVVVASPIFNPWFHSPEGIDFVCALLARLDDLPQFSPATRKATIRFNVTQPALVIPLKRLWFRLRHGFWPISLLALSPTRKCNLACPGCFGGGHGAQELDFDTVSRVVTEANRMGLYMFALIGGEPLCWPPLLDLVAKHRASNFGIYTNGTLVTPALAKRLAELGNANLDFSIEGFEAETDARRGSGVFAKVLEGMAVCRAAGVHFGYSVTVTRDNNELVVSDEFVDFFIRQGCFDGWYYQYMPVGCSPSAALLPTPEQRDHRRRRFVELRRTREINLFDFLNDGPLVGGCLCAGRRYVHINARGDVEPCAFYPFAVDNIHDHSLAEALDSEFFRQIRARQGRTANPLAPCPIVDHPEYLREAVTLAEAQPSQETAQRLFTDLSQPLDEYASAYRELADKARNMREEDRAAARRL